MSHLTIRTQEADISPFYRGKWQQRKSGLAHWTGLEPECQTSAQGPLPCETASVQWAALFCHLCLTHSKICPLLSLPWAPATGRPWRSPDVQVTQAASQLSAAGPRVVSQSGSRAESQLQGRPPCSDTRTGAPLQRCPLPDTGILLCHPRAAPLWPEVSLVTGNQAQGMLIV